jgi:uncharacterized membrane protein
VSRWRAASPWLLAGLLGGAGLLHLLVPGPYDRIVPGWLPAPRAWTYGSGVVELAVAAAVAAPRTRRQGALAAAVLFVAVFPANVQMALDAESTPARAVAYARLPLQVPLVLWALQVRRQRGSGRSDQWDRGTGRRP